MIQSGNKGPTSVEIGSRRASSITGDKSTAAAGRWRRRAGHFHTEDDGAAVGDDSWAMVVNYS